LGGAPDALSEIEGQLKFTETEEEGDFSQKKAPLNRYKRKTPGKEKFIKITAVEVKDPATTKVRKGEPYDITTKGEGRENHLMTFVLAAEVKEGGKRTRAKKNGFN